MMRQSPKPYIRVQEEANPNSCPVQTSMYLDDLLIYPRERRTTEK